MSKQKEDAYILGTKIDELHRLGLQHQVWSVEASKGWELAGFTVGHTLLDLGCGPGFCTTELAYIAGREGKVIGVDKSASFIKYLEQINRHYNLNIELQCTDFNDMKLHDSSLDGVYVRWALAWISNPIDIINKIHKALVPGGVIVAHEYFNWSTFKTEPFKPALAKAITAALQSFKDQQGSIDIGRKLPGIFNKAGFEIINTRPMTKTATPDEFVWQWPKSFINIYFPGLVMAGYLTNLELKSALQEFEELESESNAIIFCPQMIEVIAKKK
jgi:ubiquinone/menaquinone biosynthesis C-methylase UbiE